MFGQVRMGTRHRNERRQTRWAEGPEAMRISGELDEGCDGGIYNRMVFSSPFSATASCIIAHMIVSGGSRTGVARSLVVVEV